MRTTRTVRGSQNGQTIAIVAVSMVGLLAISSLAIDLTTLYVARSEIQHAADAAALAGAKALADSGVTSDPNNTQLQNLAQNLAGAYVRATVTQNFVSGVPAKLVGSPAINFNLPGNPRITVTLQRTGLPIFFGRIFGNRLASVSTSAIAEAYNPAYSQGNAASFIPSAPKCVKPFLVPNGDQNQGGTQFVDPNTGAVKQTGTPFIGERITLTPACTNAPGSCTIRPAGRTIQPNEYLPMLAPTTHQYCPSSGSTGCSGNTGTDFESSTRCCDGMPFDFRQCGTSGAAYAAWDPNTNPGKNNGPAHNGLQCLLHTANNGPAPDSINPLNFNSNGPPQISPGGFTQSRYGVSASSLIGTSDSIVTVPLFDNRSGLASTQVTIVGFLQIFVNSPGQNGSGGGPKPGDLDGYILNVVGCGDGASNTAVSGGGSSPVPVRLIHN